MPDDQRYLWEIDDEGEVHYHQNPNLPPRLRRAEDLYAYADATLDGDQFTMPAPERAELKRLVANFTAYDRELLVIALKHRWGMEEVRKYMQAIESLL